MLKSCSLAGLFSFPPSESARVLNSKPACVSSPVSPPAFRMGQEYQSETVPRKMSVFQGAFPGFYNHGVAASLELPRCKNSLFRANPAAFPARRKVGIPQEGGSRGSDALLRCG